MAGGKASSRKVAIAERSAKALQLRKTGASYRAISKAIRVEFDLPTYSEAQAHRDVSKELERIGKKTSLDAHKVRTLELERLDTYLLAIARDVQAGDLSAIGRALDIASRRAKLLGIDAPIQLKVQELVTAQVDAEFDLFFEEIQKDDLLSPEAKERIFSIAQNLSDRAEMAATN